MKWLMAINALGDNYDDGHLKTPVVETGETYIPTFIGEMTS